MKLLLDTHILIWSAMGIEHVPESLRGLVQQADSELHFSAASIWEIAIKRGLERQDFQLNPRVLRRGLLDNGYTEIPILSEHAVAIDALPPLHKDPFDRLLIAQATVEGITLLTNDAMVAKYPGPIRCS